MYDIFSNLVFLFMTESLPEKYILVVLNNEYASLNLNFFSNDNYIHFVLCFGMIYFMLVKDYLVQVILSCYCLYVFY